MSEMCKKCKHQSSLMTQFIRCELNKIDLSDKVVQHQEKECMIISNLILCH